MKIAVFWDIKTQFDLTGDITFLGDNNEECRLLGRDAVWFL
jgi:hypothetical protein